MFKSYVYIIKDKKTGYYKIGKSNNFFRRFSQIVGFFTFLKLDYKNSFFIKLNNEQEALQLEKILHDTFRQKHISSKKAPYYDGRTEWFYLNEEDLNFIKIEIKKQFGLKMKNIGLFKYFLHFFIKNRLMFNLVY